jgi:hypothetical protein
MIENAIRSKELRRMLGLSLPDWESVMLASLAFAAIAAGAVGVSTYAVVQLQRHEAAEAKAALEEYKLKAAQDIEATKASAAIANEKAESERLEGMKLERQIASRRLSPEQESTLVAALMPISGKSVSVISYVTDVEGDLLRGQIVGCLLQSRLIVLDKPSKTMSLGPVFTTIQVGGRNAAVVGALRDALTKAGGLAVAEPWAEVPGWNPMQSFPEGAPIADAAIFIGAKPPHIPQ